MNFIRISLRLRGNLRHFSVKPNSILENTSLTLLVHVHYYDDMTSASSPCAVFRSSDFNSVVAEPIGLRQCLPIASKKYYPRSVATQQKNGTFYEDTLKHTRSACVYMTCQHYYSCCDRHCRTILTSHLHQRLIPHRDHLTSKCLCWMQRLEKKIGWCPEAA